MGSLDVHPHQAAVMHPNPSAAVLSENAKWGAETFVPARTNKTSPTVRSVKTTWGAWTPTPHSAVTRCPFLSLLGGIRGDLAESQYFHKHPAVRQPPSPSSISRGHLGNNNKHSYPSQPGHYQQEPGRELEPPPCPVVIRSPSLTWGSGGQKWGLSLLPQLGKKKAVSSLLLP